MRSHKQSLFIRAVYVSIDIACIFGAIYMSLTWRQSTLPFEVSWAGFFSSANPFKVVFLLWVPVILFFNQAHNLYQTHREMLESLEIWQVIKSVAAASLVIIVLAYLLKVQDFPRGVMISSALGIAFLSSIWRVFKKLLVNYLVSRGYNNYNALIIGAGKVGALLAQEIQKRPSLGVKLIGFLDDEKQSSVPVEGMSVLGSLHDLRVISKRKFVNKVFITIYPSHEMFIKLLEDAKDQSIAVRVVPQGYEFMAQDCTKYNIGIVPILEYSDIEVNYRQRAKRIFDVFLSLGLMIFLAPFFVILAVLIKLDSHGPVFYQSKRYGRHGKIFHMYKFRSMVQDADEILSQLKEKNEVDGPIFKMKKDPRITKLGAFLRKYSIDELPQILNVLKGDMSLVGPRPFPIEQIEREDLRQLKRLNTRPGITGLWQIRGRSDLSFDKLLRWDIWYINNWSFGLDIYILLQTIPVVLKAKGAY